MANRVLTDDERIVLISSLAFRKKVQMALRNKGDWWSVHDGTGFTGSLALLIKWAKNRINGVKIKKNDYYVTNEELTTLAMKVSKGMEFDLEAAPVVEVELLEAITVEKFDEMCDYLMDMFAEDIDMTIGSN